MADDRPLTSEEMIRRAREDLAQASKIPTPDVEEASADTELDDEPDSDDPEPFTTARAQRPSRPTRRSRPLPPDPFSGSSRPRRQQTTPPAVAIIISVVLAVMGIAVLLAVAANAP